VKKLAYLILPFILVMSLCACGGSSSNDVDTSSYNKGYMDALNDINVETLMECNQNYDTLSEEQYDAISAYVYAALKEYTSQQSEEHEIHE